MAISLTQRRNIYDCRFPNSYCWIEAKENDFNQKKNNEEASSSNTYMLSDGYTPLVMNLQTEKSVLAPVGFQDRAFLNRTARDSRNKPSLGLGVQLHVDFHALRSMQGIDGRSEDIGRGLSSKDLSDSLTARSDVCEGRSMDSFSVQSEYETTYHVTHQSQNSKHQEPNYGNSHKTIRDVQRLGKEIKSRHSTKRKNNQQSETSDAVLCTQALKLDIPNRYEDNLHKKRPDRPTRVRKMFDINGKHIDNPLPSSRPTLQTDLTNMRGALKTQSTDTLNNDETERRKKLQWMNITNSTEDTDLLKRNSSAGTQASDPTHLNGGKRNSIIHVDDWAIIEKEMKRYAQKSEGFDSNLQVFLNSLSSAHSFNRMDWKTLVKRLNEEGKPSSDFFSIYSWSTRKKISETNPLTAYVRNNTEITSERLQRDLHIGHLCSEEDKAKEKRRLSRQAVPGPLGSKYVRAPGGHAIRSEKSKTPGELAIAEGRVRNSVPLSSDDLSTGRLCSTREDVQLPDIHLPHNGNRNPHGSHGARRLAPRKANRSQNSPHNTHCPTSNASFDFTIMNNNSGGGTPMGTNRSVWHFSDSGSRCSSTERVSLPPLNSLTSGFDCGSSCMSPLAPNTVYATKIRPIPREATVYGSYDYRVQAEARNYEAFLSYIQRMRAANTPRPPPATPVNPNNSRLLSSSQLMHDGALSKSDFAENGIGHINQDMNGDGNGFGEAQRRDNDCQNQDEWCLCDMNGYCEACMSETLSSLSASSVTSESSSTDNDVHRLKSLDHRNH